MYYILSFGVISLRDFASCHVHCRNLKKGSVNATQSGQMNLLQFLQATAFVISAFWNHLSINKTIPKNCLTFETVKWTRFTFILTHKCGVVYLKLKYVKKSIGLEYDSFIRKIQQHCDHVRLMTQGQESACIWINIPTNRQGSINKD